MMEKPVHTQRESKASTTFLLVNRETLSVELRKVFDRQTTEILLNVLDQVASQVYAASVPREDFTELKQIVARIGERVEEIAVIQQQMQKELAELAEMRREHEKRLQHIEGDVTVLKDDVAVLKTDVAVLKTDVAVLKTDVAVLKTDVAVLKTDVAGLKTDVAGLKTDVAGLKTDVAGLKTDVAGLKTDMKEVKTDVGMLKGHYLETRYRDRAPSFFGRWLRRPKAVDVNKLWDVLEKSLTEEEFESLLALDLIVSGKLKHHPEGSDVYLAIEVSATIDAHDVERASQRAQLLHKSGYRAIPVVAGEKLSDGVRETAAMQGVVIVQDGLRLLWDEALARWIPSAA